MKELENLEKRLADIQKEIETLKQAKPEFEVGKWYYFSDGTNHWLAKFDYMKDGYFWYTQSYAINFLSENRSRDWCIIPKTVRPATHTEIEEALKKEAVKKGFEVGDQITGLWPYDESMKPVINNSIGGYYYIPESDTFGLNNTALYCQGVWATVIKKQPLMIGEYPVKSAIEGVTINHTFYPESSIFKIKEALEVSNVKSVNVGCNGQYKVDLEMINKIIKLIK